MKGLSLFLAKVVGGGFLSLLIILVSSKVAFAAEKDFECQIRDKSTENLWLFSGHVVIADDRDLTTDPNYIVQKAVGTITARVVIHGTPYYEEKDIPFSGDLNTLKNDNKVQTLTLLRTPEKETGNSLDLIDYHYDTKKAVVQLALTVQEGRLIFLGYPTCN